MKQNQSFQYHIKSPMQIGNLVRKIRKKYKLTQSEAASLCHVGTRFLSDMENGKPSLHLGKVMHVIQVFGLKVLLQPKGLPHD